MGEYLTSRDMIQKAGTEAEKALLLGPTSQNSLASGICSIRLVASGVAQSYWGKMVFQVDWTHVIRFIGSNQHLDLDPAVNWQPLQHAEQRCYRGGEPRTVHAAEFCDSCSF